MNLIRMINVEKTYKTGVTAIYDLNLTIEKGEFVFVIGANWLWEINFNKNAIS